MLLLELLQVECATAACAGPEGYEGSYLNDSTRRFHNRAAQSAQRRKVNLPKACFPRSPSTRSRVSRLTKTCNPDSLGLGLTPQFSRKLPQKTRTGTYGLASRRYLPMPGGARPSGRKLPEWRPLCVELFLVPSLLAAGPPLGSRAPVRYRVSEMGHAPHDERRERPEPPGLPLPRLEHACWAGTKQEPTVPESPFFPRPTMSAGRLSSRRRRGSCEARPTRTLAWRN